MKLILMEFVSIMKIEILEKEMRKVINENNTCPFVSMNAHYVLKLLEVADRAKELTSYIQTSSDFITKIVDLSNDLYDTVCDLEGDL